MLLAFGSIKQDIHGFALGNLKQPISVQIEFFSERVHFAADKGNVVKLKELIFPNGEKSQRESVDGWPSFIEEVVQYWQQNSLREVSREQCHDPSSGDHLQVQAKLLEVRVQAWQLFLDQLVKDVAAKEVLRHPIVEEWNKFLVQDQSHKYVECQFFVTQIVVEDGS